MTLRLLGFALGSLGLVTACTGDDAPASDGSSSSTSSGQVGPFEFDPSPPSAYRQVDRAAMPGVVTALITSQDTYNTASPADDAAGTYLEEIRANLTALHGIVDDDLTDMGLTPCEIETCLAQVTPAVVPDMIVIDPTMPSQFPNGRPLDTQVMDLTLAVLLLDLSVEPITTFAEMPMNPPSNDKPFLTEFPYLADPHQ